MRTIRTAVVLLLSLLSLASFAEVEYLEEAYTDSHGNFFATGGRKIALVAPQLDEVLEARLSDFFSRCGSRVEYGPLASVLYPTVSLKQKKSDQEGYSIRVRGSSIQISYSSPVFASKAVDALMELFAEPYAQRMIRGVDVFSFATAQPLPTNSLAAMRHGGVMDCAEKFQSSASIQSALKQQAEQGLNGVVVLVGSPEAMRLNLQCLKLFNPSATMVPKNETYTKQMAADILRSAQQNKVEVTLGLDLLSDNPKFRKWSGHDLSSVEGMRLVRAMIEELAEEWGVRKLYIGSNNSTYATDVRYRDFLDQIAARNNIELEVR